MLLTQIIVAVLSILVPVFYSTLAGIEPPFPLSPEQLQSVLVWLVSVIIGTGSIENAVTRISSERFDPQLSSIPGVTVRSVTYFFYLAITITAFIFA